MSAAFAAVSTRSIAYGKNVSPSRVRETSLFVRKSNFAFSCVSRSLMLRLIFGCGTLFCLAASEKFRSCATDMKYLRFSVSNRHSPYISGILSSRIKSTEKENLCMVSKPSRGLAKQSKAQIHFVQLQQDSFSFPIGKDRPFAAYPREPLLRLFLIDAWSLEKTARKHNIQFSCVLKNYSTTVICTSMDQRKICL